MYETLAELPKAKAEQLGIALGVKFGLSSRLRETDERDGGEVIIAVEYEPDRCAVKPVVLEHYVDGWIDRGTAGV
jgi:hypothetical protein